MCWLCERYGNGDHWYFNPQNYARRLYKRRQKGTRPKGGGEDPEAMAGRIIEEAVEAKWKDPEHFEEKRQLATEMARQYSVGQVVTLDEAMQVVEVASPLALMSCICRKNLRASEERDEREYSCLGLGVGMFKWDRWPERYKGGVKFVTPSRAKQWLERWSKRGLMQTLMTFGTPYIGGLCNCEDVDCLAVRWRLDYGIEMLMKSHYVAKVDFEKCIGCKDCLERCHFGSLKLEAPRRLVRVDAFSCYGCQACQFACDYEAIRMVPRSSLPPVAQVW
jgi:NAD-dependent dihydropyrimidine dehydrogenase PreA subunit